MRGINQPWGGELGREELGRPADKGLWPQGAKSGASRLEAGRG